MKADNETEISHVEKKRNGTSPDVQSSRI